MLDKHVANYFQHRDQQSPVAPTRRRYFSLMFAVTEEILQMRKRVGLTQQELARGLRTTQSTVARWETPGYTGYTLKKLFAIADKLGYALQISFVPVPTYSQDVPANWDNPSLGLVQQELSHRAFSAPGIYPELQTMKGRI